MNTFDTLFSLDVGEHIEKKRTGKATLSYLSWPWAWAYVKRTYPDASYTIERDERGLPYRFDPQTGYMVFTTVTINGITHMMWLPVMDSHNDAMLDHPRTVKTKWSEYEVPAATMFDVNKTIMRCLVKNLAMFGLGLNLYAGEDLPMDIESGPEKPSQAATGAKAKEKRQSKGQRELDYSGLMEAVRQSAELLGSDLDHAKKSAWGAVRDAANGRAVTQEIIDHEAEKLMRFVESQTPALELAEDDYEIS